MVAKSWKIRGHYIIPINSISGNIIEVAKWKSLSQIASSGIFQHKIKLVSINYSARIFDTLTQCRQTLLTQLETLTWSIPSVGNQCMNVQTLLNQHWQPGTDLVRDINTANSNEPVVAIDTDPVLANGTGKKITQCDVFMRKWRNIHCRII